MPCLKNATRWFEWLTFLDNLSSSLLFCFRSWTRNPPILGLLHRAWIFQQWVVACNRPLLRSTTRTNYHRSMSIVNRLRNVSYVKRKQVWRLPISAGQWISKILLASRTKRLALPISDAVVHSAVSIAIPKHTLVHSTTRRKESVWLNATIRWSLPRNCRRSDCTRMPCPSPETATILSALHCCIYW